MNKLLKKKGDQPEKLPMPFGGRIILTLYWWIYRIFFFRGKKDYEATIKELDTPLKVQAWLWANIKYTSDKNPADHWQPAERTFDRKRGDCIAYNTYIPTKIDDNLELRQIGDIVENKIECSVPSMKNGTVSWNRILSFQKKGKKELYRITMKNGRSVDVTDNHRFYTMNDDGFLSEIFVKDMKPGNYILGVNGIPTIDKEPPVPKELLWVDGIYIAEGWSWGGKVCIGNKDPNVLKRIMNTLVDNDIPFHFYDRKNHTPYITIKKSWYKDRLKLMGNKSTNKHFLSEHLSMNENNIEILLDGYREGDAYKSPKRVDNTIYIYGTTSPILIKQLEFLHNMLRKPLHIEFRSSSGGGGKHPLPIWRGYYNPQSDFANIIPKPQIIHNKIKDVYPTYGGGRGGKSPGVYCPIQKNSFTSFKNKDSLEKLQRYIDLSFMMWAINDHYEWFEIKDIEHIGKGKTYDIEVENDHNFILWNDVLVHNCEDWAIFANECLKDKYDGYFLCMYTNDSGHASYVIKKEAEKKVSVGTFGYMTHKGSWGEIIPDWRGYEDCEMYKVKNENLDTIKRVPNVFDW